MTTRPSDLGRSTVTLRSDRLLVDIARPGVLYSGARFDWTGFITQVTLDRRHTFCVPESLVEGQGSGGIGLCNEFGIDQPIGYQDCPPGGTFPKLGIGLLQRLDAADYQFSRPYPIARAFPMRFDLTENSATFIAEPVDCRGYAARLTKTLRVQGAELRIDYQLENTGAQPLATHEYCHNFVGIDSAAIGPDYRLRLPYAPRFEDLTAMARGSLPRAARRLLPPGLQRRLAAAQVEKRMRCLRIDGDVIGFSDAPREGLYLRPLGFSKTYQPQWEMTHASGVALREYDDFAPCRVAVFGTLHVLSPEVFASVDVQPGQAQRWSRRYEFIAP